MGGRGNLRLVAAMEEGFLHLRPYWQPDMSAAP